MFDTNILISAALFGGKLSCLVDMIAERHSVVLTKEIIDEFWSVIERKFPMRKESAVTFMRDLRYTLARSASAHDDGAIPVIRDAGDIPILKAAIVSGVDALITGDDDFHAVACEKPSILSIAEFARLHLPRKD
jgi:putative PIN family toxin of toxin-antitoxin system